MLEPHEARRHSCAADKRQDATQGTQRDVVRKPFEYPAADLALREGRHTEMLAEEVFGDRWQARPGFG